MLVTDVRVELVTRPGHLKARATVDFDQEFTLDGFTVWDYGNGPVVRFPARKLGDKWLPVAWATKPQLAEHVQREVAKNYMEALSIWLLGQGEVSHRGEGR